MNAIDQPSNPAGPPADRATQDRPATPNGANHRPIADYALIGDMRGAALVAGDAAIEWLCMGRFDTDPTFAAILDTGIGGACTIELAGGMTHASRQYRAGTNILETTLHCATGRLLVTDCMPVRQKPDQGDVGADSEAANRVLRCIVCEAGEVAVTVTVTPGFDWGRRRVRATTSGMLGGFQGESLQMASSHAVLAKGQSLATQAMLSAGEHLVVVLGQAELTAQAAHEAHAQLAETTRYWHQWQERCTYKGEHSAAVLRSALCLKLLIYAPTGAMVAAPTAGLPEVPGGVRNWDYRFVWSRDASFSISAFLKVGHRREAAEFLRFLHGACQGKDPVQVMYAVEGALPEEQELTHLAGWKGSGPVLVGNAASDQQQHEIYGELLAAVFLYMDRHGTEGLCPELVRDLPDFVHRLAEAAIEKWPQPDQGIWELRGPPRHLLHSKAMCWVAVDRALQLAPLLGFAAPAHWAGARDAILAECFAKGWNEEAQAFTMEFGSPVLDMSVLRLVLMGMIQPGDPRLSATMAALQTGLGHGDLYRRYRFDDGLPGEESAFIACSFWMMGARSRQGDHTGALGMMERMLVRTNDLGLLAEEMDVETGEQLGNFPQAFSHLALIHEAVALSENTGRHSL